MAALRSLCGWMGLLCLFAALAWMPARAQVQASLDRDRLNLGEVATLTISSSGSTDASPDFSPLEQDFLIYAPNQRRYSEMINGRFSSRVEYVLGIQPRRPGRLVVPSLHMGSQRTPALELLVQASATPGADAVAGPPLSFIRTRVDTAQPWVHQSVGVVVALYYATQLAAGELVQDAPEQAGLQRVGDDRVDQVMVDGRHYNRVERRYLLLPERSGSLTLPPARFRGRAVGAGRGQLLSAQQDPPLQLQVRARPADARSPWLPLHDLLLGWQVVPQRIEAGRGVELVLEAQLDGATRAQLDTLPLPAAGPGYQLYPQATEVEESFHGDRPQLLLRRRVVLLAEAPGTVQLPALELGWWQVEQGQWRRTVQPAVSITVVAAGAGGRAAGGTPPVAVPMPMDERGVDAVAPVLPARGAWYGWTGLAALLLLALAGLLWWWQRRAHNPPPAALPAVTRPGLAQLQQQLAQGGLQDILDTLMAMAAVNGRQALYQALADPQQRQALEQAEQVWWGVQQGDRVAMRSRLRQVFASGPQWQPATPHRATVADPLPPLYPPV